MDKLSFLSKNVELSEQQSNGNLVAKFCLCDFSVNGNGVQINRDNIDKWVGTLINQPLVGRIGYSGDFTGHNMRVGTYVDAEGNEQEDVMFDTEAIGTFTSVGIEAENNVDYIVGSAEIWSRYPNVCELIKRRVADGELHTSWEILVNQSHVNGNVKVIDDGVFTALCVLGKNVTPAFASSRLLEVAEDDTDVEMAEAISHDISACEEDKKMTEDVVVSAEEHEELAQGAEVAEEAIDVVSEQADPEVSAEEKPEENEEPAPQQDDEEEDDESAACNPEKKKCAEASEKEVSELTARDLRDAIERAIERSGSYGYACVEFVFPESHKVWAKNYEDCAAELDFIEFEYSVNGDEVSVGEPTYISLVASPRDVNRIISEKNDAVAEACTRIAKLEAEVAELAPYKEAAERAIAEKAEADRAQKAAELSAYAVKSGLISSEEIDSDGDVKTMISELNESGIKQIIAERFMAGVEIKKPEVEVSTIKSVDDDASMNLYNGDSDVEVDIVSAYLKKKY